MYVPAAQYNTTLRRLHPCGILPQSVCILIPTPAPIRDTQLWIHIPILVVLELLHIISRIVRLQVRSQAQFFPDTSFCSEITHTLYWVYDWFWKHNKTTISHSVDISLNHNSAYGWGYKHNLTCIPHSVQILHEHYTEYGWGYRHTITCIPHCQ